MANVLFTRTDTPSKKPITDGQLIFDTSGNGKMYLDNGTERLVMGGALTVDTTLSKTSTNPIQNKGVAGVMLDNLEDISNVTSKGFLTDALATKKLNESLTNEDGEVFNFGVKDGVRGFFTDPSRADDSFIPFSSGMKSMDINFGSKYSGTIELPIVPSIVFIRSNWSEATSYAMIKDGITEFPDKVNGDLNLKTLSLSGKTLYVNFYHASTGILYYI